MKLTVAKKTRSICQVLLILMICTLFVTGCEQSNNPNIPGENNNIEIGNNFFEKMKNSDNISVLDYYPNTEYSSFVKLKVNTIYDEIFSIDNTQTTKFILLEGIVIEDYYKKIDKDTLVTIPIVLDYSRLSNGTISVLSWEKDTVTNLLQNFDFFYVYLANGLSVQKGIYSINNESIEIINSLGSQCELSLYTLLPINEEKLNISCIDVFLKDREVNYLNHCEISGFDCMIYDNQAESDFVKNVTKMYNYFNSQ